MTDIPDFLEYSGIINTENFDFGDNMKRQLELILTIVFIFVLFSCDTNLGTPPGLILSFSLDDWQNTVLGVKVDYTLTNNGDADLENCKIQIGIDTSNDGIENYDELGDYKYWTDGVDLKEGETYTVDDVEITILGDAYNVTVLATGFDNPADSKSSPGRTIIYYDKS